MGVSEDSDVTGNRYTSAMPFMYWLKMIHSGNKNDCSIKNRICSWHPSEHVESSKPRISNHRFLSLDRYALSAPSRDQGHGLIWESGSRPINTLRILPHLLHYHPRTMIFTTAGDTTLRNGRPKMNLILSPINEPFLELRSAKFIINKFASNNDFWVLWWKKGVLLPFFTLKVPRMSL